MPLQAEVAAIWAPSASLEALSRASNWQLQPLITLLLLVCVGLHFSCFAYSAKRRSHSLTGGACRVSDRAYARQQLGTTAFAMSTPCRRVQGQCNISDRPSISIARRAEPCMLQKMNSCNAQTHVKQQRHDTDTACARQQTYCLSTNLMFWRKKRPNTKT